MAEYIEKNVAIARLTALEIGNPCATMIDAKRQIADTRSADVAPVIHARWVDGKCSNCGVDIPTDDAHDAIFENECRFCYYCGAMMEGGTTMRLINADDAKQTYTVDMFDTKEDFERVNDVLDYAPAIDAVAVTRCKDCKYAEGKKETNTEKRYAADILFCQNSELCGDEPLAMWPNDFCSYGEPKS